MSKNRTSKSHHSRNRHTYRFPTRGGGRHATARECSRTHCEAIEGYVAQHLGPARHVLHEIESEIVHVDVHIVPPGGDHPFWFLFTTGMSALPMNAPRGCMAYAELSLMLPAWWEVDMGRWKEETRWFWPIRELISLARYPHRYRTWLGEGHSITNGTPPEPYDAATNMAAMLLLPSTVSADLIEGDVPTQLLAMWPLHADELEYKRAHGLGALCDRLEAARVTCLLDPDRPSAVREEASHAALAN